MSSVYIVSYSRTPIGRFGGLLKDVAVSDLGAHAMRSCLEKVSIAGRCLDLYIVGNVLRAGHGMLIARQCALKAGIPPRVDGYSLDMVCASGMMSIMNAAMMIQSGNADLVLAGGVESMSQSAFTLSYKARFGYKLLMSPENVTDVLIQDGLTDPLTKEIMGAQAERIAKKYKIQRDEVDQVAYNSHQRSSQAIQKGHFTQEISPIISKNKKNPQRIQNDEGIRPETTIQNLAQLKPVFSKNGILTAGNSSQISDGAAAVLLASEKAIKRYHLTPLAEYIGSSWAAQKTYQFIETPIIAVKKLLKNTRKQIHDIDLFENNEAFALNSVLFNKILNIPYERLNIHGGAVALGHPLGSSGARIIGSLINTLTQTKKTTGLASICHGTGGATAILFRLP